jgi:hypothetical protein
MHGLKIRVFKGGAADPETTVTIPTSILQVAYKLIPHQAVSALREKGIELDEIVKLASDPQAHGTLVEVEEHRKNERIVIALE